ncbi:hypothetical protein EDC01DRAFT_609238 [Geopyxis carbonaria]|nr:hypothetical protein EDC01DRAFT_609238 [Geopyxis carbonaria]
MAATHDLHAQKLFSVPGRVCVVTGGGTGIGLMCAQGLAANGAKVYITGRRLERLQQSADQHKPDGEGQIIPIQCDVTSKSSLEELVAEIEKRGEKYIDLLVCNAGVSGPKGDPTESDASELKSKLWAAEDFDAWGDVFKTNVSAVYFTTVAFLPLLQAAPQDHGSSVITISSMSGLTKSAQGHFSYNASKAATVHLTKMMSAEFIQTGIRVNSIAPGYFPSEMTAKDSDDKTGKSHEKMSKDGWWEEKGVPAGRPGDDGEMAMAVLYLTKSRYMNGEILVVDGGALLTMGTR